MVGIIRSEFFFSHSKGWHHPFEIFLCHSNSRHHPFKINFFQCCLNVYSNCSKFFHGGWNGIWSNMSKASASVSSGVPNREKRMKARGRRPSTFTVSRCLEPLMKHEAQVFDMTSQSRLKIQCNKACKNNVFPSGMVNSSCKSLPVFWKLFVTS